MSQIADVIRAAREKAGLSQRELAQQARVSHGIIARWESGSRVPSNEMKLQLAQALQLEPAELGVNTTPVLHISDPLTVKMVMVFERLPARTRKNIADIVDMAADIARDIREQRHPIQPPTLRAY